MVVLVFHRFTRTPQLADLSHFPFRIPCRSLTSFARQLCGTSPRRCLCERLRFGGLPRLVGRAVLHNVVLLIATCPCDRSVPPLRTSLVTIDIAAAELVAVLPARTRRDRRRGSAACVLLLKLGASAVGILAGGRGRDRTL